jgi:transposase
MKVEKSIRAKYRGLQPTMNERSRRLWAGAEAKVLGRGGIAIVARATGLARKTVIRGVAELGNKKIAYPQRVRCPGAGRKRKIELMPGLVKTLEELVEPVTRGDPESPLRWTSKSTRHLAVELDKQGYKISHKLVGVILHELDYSLQGNRKTLEGSSHPDRNEQFEYINKTAKSRLKRGEPVISVDTKKKELVGRFKNVGEEWRAKGNPEEVKVHDFPEPDKAKAIPYGVYDLKRNVGWVSVGIDHDTAAFAVETIRRWWRQLGRKSYPHAKSLLITADSGGSNGSRLRLWKWELQKLANQIGMTISVCHFPPGTSKWNKIEHRLFSFISKNWRGRPLLTHAIIVNLIAATKTTTGLKVHCVLDSKKYPKAIKPTAEQIARINLKPHKFHGDWNYTIVPDKK